MAKRSYSDETKAAVMAALLAGQSVSSLAREYQIPEGTLKSWQSREVNGARVAVVATQKKERIGELIVSYLEDLLVTLHAQQKVFQDEKWL